MSKTSISKINKKERFQNTTFNNSKFFLPAKPSISPKRQLGQNFLVDKNIVRKIIQYCDLRKTDTVLEIGPGFGALTEEIAPRVKKLIAIETDSRLYRELVSRITHRNTKFILADFLKFDITDLPQNLKVIGNLPYYICSQIIAKILNNKNRFCSLFTTIQLELGRRIVAKPNTKDYSAFSVFVQYHAICSMCFKIKNTSFRPIPKVQSCFMRLHLQNKPILRTDNSALLWKIVHQAFGQRRKTIPNALSKTISKEEIFPILKALNIDLRSRAENLQIKNFVDLANVIHSKRIK